MRASVSELLQLGEALFAAGDVAGARRAFCDAVAADPQNAAALHALGWLAHQEKDYAKAAELIGRAVGIDGSRPGYWNNLGVARLAGGDAKAAEASFRRVIELRPDFAPGHLNLGNAARDQGQWDKAREAYFAAVERDPALIPARHALAIALRQTGRIQEAIEELDTALRLAPASPELHGERGVVLERVGRIGEAERSFRTALELRPRDARAARHLAALLLRTDRTAEAVRLLGELAAGNAADAPVRQLLGAALARAGRYEDAVAELRRAAELDPTSAACWCNLGLALEDVGQAEEAIKALGEARRLAPAWSVPQFHLAALGAGPPPATCPPDYLVEFFDAYSGRFDQHLAGDLAYRGPEAVVAAAAAARPEGFEVAFDLGCGTGLCGVLLRPKCRRLVGIDAAPRMIERAGARGVYDELITSDIVETLRVRPASADVAVAADVLIYIGELKPLFGAVRALLRPGGLFIFTTESADDAEAGAPGYALRRTRRYAHAAWYVKRIASASGLVIVEESALDLRRGPEAPVGGVVYTAATRGP